MKLQLRSYLGETLMLFPNINLWTDNDPDYAPHKYHLFLGWLFWGIRIFFGKAEPQGEYTVRVIHNDAKNKSYYVLTKTEVSEDLNDTLSLTNIGTHIYDHELTPEENAAIQASIPLKVITSYDDTRWITAFPDINSAFLIRDLINRIRAKETSDQWRIVKYRQMYMSHNGV